MSKVAERLTGMTESQLREYQFRRVTSKKDVYYPRIVHPRGNVRLGAGMMVGEDDLQSIRRRLARYTPKCLRG